jgi:sigma-B regulation protein RsbU (phosphoserine phosphatase)
MKPIESTQPWDPIPSADDKASLPPEPVWIKFEPAWEEPSPSAAPVEVTLAPTPLKTGLPIIIADDDPVSRELISQVVKKWGFQTIVTRDGHEALEAIRAQLGAAIAILDWMMPGMDGLQVCQRVRASKKMTYIILLSARGGTENLVEGLECGADDYLVKPFDKNELLARVKVGVRVLDLQTSLANRVKELEHASSEIRELKLQMPL